MKKILRSILPLVCFALCITSAYGATNYWDIDGATAGAGGATPSGTWDTGTTANWSTDPSGASAATTFTDNDDAVFSAGSDATGTFAVDLSGSPVVGDLTVEEGTITISGGTALNVGGGVALKGVIDVAPSSTLTISSVVTGGDDTGSITKGVEGAWNTGTLVLSGANTYIGQTSLRFGTLSFDSLGNVNAGASALGNPADVTLGTIQLGSSSGGYEVTLQYIGSGHTSDRVINLAGNEGIINLDASGSGPIVFTSADGITVTGNGIHTLQLFGTNADENTITGTIVNGLNYTKVAKYGPGTWVLLGNSTFTGVFDIRDGTVVVNSISDQYAPSSLGTGGQGTQHAIIGFAGQNNGVTNATLKYIGSGHSSTRPMRMYGTQGNAGGATIDASGTGPLVLSGDMLRPAASANDFVDKTVTLTGTNTGANTFRGLIVDSSTAPGKTIVVKDGPGKWLLTGNNLYTGATVVKQGTFLVSGLGVIASGSAVTVNSGAILGGSGIINGPVTVDAGATLSPGDSVGTLTLGNDLTLSGNLFIELDKSLAPDHDIVTVAGTLTNAGTGTVTVTNLGPALTVGDNFMLFNKAAANGEALTVTSADGVVWTNKLWVDGSIEVLSVGGAPPPVPATNLTITAISPTSFSLGGMGAANSAYDVYASTNVALPMTQWWLIGSTNSDGGGVIQFLDPQATNDQRFYRFGQ